MVTRRVRWATLWALALAGGLAASARAEITAEQKTQAKEIDEKLAEATRLLQKSQNEEAGKLVEEAQTLWGQLASGGKGTDYSQLVDRLKSGISLRRRLLEGRGVKLPPLPEAAKTPGKTFQQDPRQVGCRRRELHASDRADHRGELPELPRQRRAGHVQHGQL